MDSTQDDEVEAARIGAGDFPRALPEDNVGYEVYMLDKNIPDTQRRDELRKIQAASTALIKKHLRNYIWEQDYFELKLAKKDDFSYLQGRMSYGDSIEDEWLIVWLLIEVSKQFENAWCRVSDSDGEFLLIEAANSLPKWLNPEIADHRVWINHGQLKIIPKSTKKSAQAIDYAASLELSRALDFLRTNSGELLVDSKIENEAFYRVKKYPAGISDSLHHALIRVPRKVAFLLHKKPAYISSAVEAFYLRDPIALKPLQAAGQEKLIFPTQDLVTCRTRFTRVGFAKVRSQKFPYPPSWAAAEVESKDAKIVFQAEMGMKLACGFEMLLTDPQNQDKKIVREINLILEDLESGEEVLPTDAEIESWGITEDSDAWLDINYQDFEQELAGKKGSSKSAKGFGNIDTQEKLRKMVSRFEDLMAEDGDMDDMDEDNDSEADAADTDTDAASTNSAEEDFNEMMREMLGMDKETMDEMMGKIKSEMESKGKGKAQIIDEDSDDENDILELNKAMEAELRAHGALDLNDEAKKQKKVVKSATVEDAADEDGSSEEELLDEDYNLAKNMLEAFKSQAGAAGPAGNMMGMMGMNLPRDEGDSE